MENGKLLLKESNRDCPHCPKGEVKFLKSNYFFCFCCRRLLWEVGIDGVFVDMDAVKLRKSLEKEDSIHRLGR